MKTDIQTPQDIRLLVDSFYQKVQIDPLIGPIFNEIANIDWDAHLPKMYAFWENIVFNTHTYTGNPMRVHVDLHQHFPLEKPHFDRWLLLFMETVEALFDGENTELVKHRAQSIATLIQIKTQNASRI